jgi:hypothetical protein
MERESSLKVEVVSMSGSFSVNEGSLNSIFNALHDAEVDGAIDFDFDVNGKVGVAVLSDASTYVQWSHSTNNQSQWLAGWVPGALTAGTGPHTIGILMNGIQGATTGLQSYGCIA